MILAISAEINILYIVKTLSIQCMEELHRSSGDLTYQRCWMIWHAYGLSLWGVSDGHPYVETFLLLWTSRVEMIE